MGNKKNTSKGESNLPTQQQDHKLNAVGSETVNEFLNAFDTNKLGTCLEMIQSGQIIIIDKDSIARQMEKQQILIENNNLLKETLQERTHDLAIVIDTTMKLETIYDPINETIEKSFSSSDESETKIKLGTWIKVFGKLANVFYKNQKKIFKVLEEVNINGLKEIYNKYNSIDYQKIDEDNMRKLDEPTEQKQLPPSPDASQDVISSVGDSTPTNSDSK